MCFSVYVCVCVWAAVSAGYSALLFLLILSVTPCLIVILKLLSKENDDDHHELQCESKENNTFDF